MKKILKWGGIILVIFIVIGVIASSGSKDSKKVGENGSTNTTQTDNKQPEQPASYKVGDKIQLGNVILTVNKVETSTSGQYTQPSEGNQSSIFSGQNYPLSTIKQMRST